MRFCVLIQLLAVAMNRKCFSFDEMEPFELEIKHRYTAVFFSEIRSNKNMTSILLPSSSSSDFDIAAAAI